MSMHQVDQIQEVLNATRPDEPLGEQLWHQAAPAIFVRPDKDFAREVVDFGIDLLQTFPYERLAESIKASSDSKSALEEERLMRKVLMIGRDAVNLANVTDLIQVRSMGPWRKMITVLGTVSDTKGQKKGPLKQAIKAVEPADQAAQSINPAFINPVRGNELLERSRSALQTSILTLPKRKVPDEDSYHVARRSFRKVVHLGVVSYLLQPADAILPVVTEGVDLNAQYGRKHTKLKH